MRKFRPGRGHLVLHGISDKQIAEWVKVTDRTARRWKAGEEPPYAALLVIELRQNGDLGIIDPAWDGWYLRDGKIYGPTDESGFAPGDVISIHWLRQIISSYQADQRLPRQADWVAGEWQLAKEVQSA